jgi:hypothetical protein
VGNEVKLHIFLISARGNGECSGHCITGQRISCTHCVKLDEPLESVYKQAYVGLYTHALAHISCHLFTSYGLVRLGGKGVPLLLLLLLLLLLFGLENRDYGRRGSAALTMQLPSIRKSWHFRRQAAVARSV